MLRLAATAIALAAATLAVGCSSPDDVVEARRGEVSRELATLAKIGADANAAPAARPGGALRAPSAPVVVCSMRGGALVRDCNAIVVYAETLAEPAKFREHTKNPGREHVAFGHDAAVAEPAQILERGVVVREEADPAKGPAAYREAPVTLSAKGVEVHFDDLAALRWVFVVRPDAAREAGDARSFGAGVYMYNARTGEAHGAMRVDAACADEATAPAKAGARSRCLDGAGRAAFEAELVRQIPTARVQR